MNSGKFRLSVKETYRNPYNNTTVHGKAIFRGSYGYPKNNGLQIPYYSNSKTSKLIKKNSSKFLRFLLCLISIIVLIYVKSYFVSHDVGKQIPIDLINDLKTDLKNKVLNQDKAVNVITYNLNRLITVSNEMILVPFVGTTGVGKTFTVNIIKKWLPSRIVCELDVNNLMSIEEERIKHCRVIVIDNLKAWQLDMVIKFIKNLQDLIVIPVFNLHEMKDDVIYEINKDDFQLIRGKLDQSGFDYQIALFDELDSSAVENWLRQELNKRQIDPHKKEFLISSLLDNNQVKYKGFKGLDTKLSAIDVVFN